MEDLEKTQYCMDVLVQAISHKADREVTNSFRKALSEFSKSVDECSPGLYGAVYNAGFQYLETTRDEEWKSGVERIVSKIIRNTELASRPPFTEYIKD